MTGPRQTRNEAREALEYVMGEDLTRAVHALEAAWMTGPLSTMDEHHDLAFAVVRAWLQWQGPVGVWSTDGSTDEE